MKPGRPAPAVNRAVEILDLLASHPTESFLMSELSRRLGINSASAHAVLAVLERTGYVVRHPRHRTYSLGVAAVVLGRSALQQHPAISEAAKEIVPLSTELDLEVIVTALAGESMVYVANAGRPHADSAGFRVGQQVPCVPPYGSVHMAWSSREEIAAWLDRASVAFTEDETEEQLAILAAIRRRGYAVGLDVDGAHARLNEISAELAESPTRQDLRDAIDELFIELRKHRYQLDELDPKAEYDVSMVSAPVFDPQGRVAAAITLPGFPRSLVGARIVEYAEATLRTALVVTRRIQGVRPAGISIQPV